MNLNDISFLRWEDDEDIINFEDNIKSEFDKKELQSILKRIESIQSILTDRVNSICDDVKLVYKATVWLEKEGNSKYIYFDVSKYNKIVDTNGKVEYTATGKLKDFNIESIKFRYRKSDKKSIRDIETFEKYILENYEVDNISQFEDEYKNLWQ